MEPEIESLYARLFKHGHDASLGNGELKSEDDAKAKLVSLYASSTNSNTSQDPFKLVLNHLDGPGVREVDSTVEDFADSLNRQHYLLMEDEFAAENLCNKFQGFNWSSDANTGNCRSTISTTRHKGIYEHIFDTYSKRYMQSLMVDELYGNAILSDDIAGPNYEGFYLNCGSSDFSEPRGPYFNNQKKQMPKIDLNAPQYKAKPHWKRRRGKNKQEKVPIVLQGLEFELVFDHLKTSVESLYKDQIHPTYFNVRSRFIEYDINSLSVEHIFNVCERRPDVFIIESLGPTLNSTSIYLVHPPAGFKKWIDRNDPNDVYPAEMWEELVALLKSVVVNPDKRLNTFPGTIYGMAKMLQGLSLRTLEKRTLGTICHIVQLAVTVKKLLVYDMKALKPNLQHPVYKDCLQSAAM